ncbi:glutamate/gamma-aminobutyrate family transporter YjeM [Liquorilactobacillus sicerae]|uniref:glutamate/gamma-aminobutyrate family transporter YjeM n=1 Tax=Liquorilactobacillus sicerae TaxID=1416943 RepID=UPI00247FB8A5|nr:glutamate/gamma-aminobutyrate family transporter YjeM [Liquorilactobacillus sicerae]
MTSDKQQLTLFSVMLMIFTSTFAFDNTSIAYYTMGYAGIIWYILAALLFFVPSTLMFSEFGAALHNQPGGVFSWLVESVGLKWAFIGGFTWIASWIILIVSTVSKIWIMLSTTISGSDQTGKWQLGSLNSTATIGLISMAFFVVVTAIATRGLGKVAHLAAVGGIAAAVLTIFFVLASFLLLIKNGFQLAEPVKFPKTFLKSPRTSYQSTSQMISFLIFAVYAYAGIEALGGVSDKMKDAKKNFPIALGLGAALISIAYALIIFLWGASANWHEVFQRSGVNLGNTTYVLMSNLGYSLGQEFGLSYASAKTLSLMFARFGSLTMLLSYLGSFFVIVYMPIKSFILGTPKELWPKSLPKLNRFGMPANAMWWQALIVCGLIAMTSLGNRSAKAFYDILTLMDNLSSTLPYLFLVTAFAFFKANTTIKKPFEFFHGKIKITLAVIVVDTLLLLGIVSTAYSAVASQDYLDLFLELIGPVAFGLIGYGLYLMYLRRKKIAR